MMRRFAFLLAIFAAFSVGMVPVADSVAKVEAALAAAPQSHHDHAAGHAAAHDHDCATGDCTTDGAKPHPGHCPACTALPAGFVPQMAVPATGGPAVSGPERLFAAFVPVDLPPPRAFPA
jgi:uncharacterized low-complexity protein